MHIAIYLKLIKIYENIWIDWNHHSYSPFFLANEINVKSSRKLRSFYREIHIAMRIRSSKLGLLRRDEVELFDRGGFRSIAGRDTASFLHETSRPLTCYTGIRSQTALRSRTHRAKARACTYTLGAGSFGFEVGQRPAGNARQMYHYLGLTLLLCN